jgi:hypothetical protein
MPRVRPFLIAACATVVLGLTACTTTSPAQLTPSESSTALIDPAPRPSESLLPDATPTGSVVGGLAPGFPSELLPVPAGATVLVSAAVPVPDSDLVDVSLNLQTDQTADDLLDAISKPLKDAGFTQAEPAQSEPDLAAQASFTRNDGKERVILGILDADGVRTLTLSGRVDPGVA